MKFSVGDIVLLKHTGEEGRVVGYINEEMVEIEVAGTHFPVFLDEVDHPYLNWFREKSNKKQEKEPKRIEDLVPEPKSWLPGGPPGFYLAFLPVFRFDEFEDVVDKLKTYFINQTAYELQLHYEYAPGETTSFAHKTVIRPFAHFYLHDIPFEQMHDHPRFSCVLTQSMNLQKATSLNHTLRIKSKKLFQYISMLQQQNLAMFHVPVGNDFPDKEEEWTQDKKKVSRQVLLKPATSFRQPAPKRIQEIDLHIEKLVSHTRGMSNFEMLQVQLAAFEEALDRAIQAQQQSFVVIHGVGKGRLKEEIHGLLKASMHVDFYMNEWNPRYGYGATEIFLRS